VDSTVLILGESGTGKELVAQALHHNSPRKSRPFVPINVAAVPATLVESELFGHVRGAFTGATSRRIGRFEQADGGTLFIDEIGDFELTLQSKLLRVLETLRVTPVGGTEERKVDVRVVAATSRDMRALVAEGKFREDLFYRLNVISVTMPPLRDRPEDIPLLVEHFMKEIASTRHVAARRVPSEVVRRFMAYRWPGNVRELRNVLESMVVLAESESLTEADVPETIMRSVSDLPRPEQIPVGLTMEQLEKLAIIKALDQTQGNRTHAAGKLGISVRTLQRKLRIYDVNKAATTSTGETLT
jgi:DNA-binding NtrC family response regulator